jgi:hypothetical protein
METDDVDNLPTMQPQILIELRPRTSDDSETQLLLLHHQLDLQP